MNKNGTPPTSNVDMDQDSPRTDSGPSRLRRIISLPGWPQQRLPRESTGPSAAPQDSGKLAHTASKMPSKPNLRRIASTSSRIFRSTTGTNTIQDKATETGDSQQVASTEMTQISRRPSVVRLRRMASMPARSLKRMTSRPSVASPDTSTSEGKYLSRVKSWSGSMRTGTSRWLGTNRKERDVPKIEVSETPARETRPPRRVHFATAELRPDIGNETSEDDNLSSYHVSLLPSRHDAEETRDGDDVRLEKWWRKDAYYAALAIPIF
ncbi:hypothetical protein N0V93_009406 [Gnomoniopsis smithogilvyi]|uniref:Uncharacterized protein n=1 Tax=Gnomoniopsis smithogilvyi TaxID=1191159 RepID=A0A9W8YJK7_9PEZI|nr:hypothetical protein N0V93_009406 [Gnomoniopsis smithogilvyi]